MDFDKNDVYLLKQFVKDVQQSVESVALTLTDIKTNDDLLNGKLTLVESKCNKEMKILSQKIHLFQSGIETLSDQLREISQNQIRLQCQLIQLNLHQNSVKAIRRTKSLDESNRPALISIAKHDSGINISSGPVDLSDHELIKDKFQVPIEDQFPESDVDNYQINYSTLTNGTIKHHQYCFQEETVTNFENERERYNLATELLENERSFCNSVSIVQSNYYEPLKSSRLIPEEDLKFLFCDALFRLYEKHCILLHKVQELLSEWIDPTYPRLIDLYSKTFTVHGSVARNYVFYSCAFNKIMELLQIYFVNNPAIVIFLQNKNENYKNDQFTMKKINFYQLEICLKAPITSMDRYINIFERFSATHDAGSFKTCHIHKLINNFKKIKEDIQRSLRFSLSSSSCDNIYRIIKTNKKKKQCSSGVLHRRNQNEHAKLPEMRENITSTSETSTNWEFCKSEQINNCSDKTKKGKYNGPTNTGSEPSLYAKPQVSYDTTGEINNCSSSDLCQNNFRLSSNSDSLRSRKGPTLDRNVNALRNTIAAFFSKRKNHQRFNEDEPLFGTLRKNKPNQQKLVSASNAEQNGNSLYCRSPSVSSTISSKNLNNNTLRKTQSSTAKQFTSVNETSNSNCVVLAYSKRNSEKIQYFVESDDSIGVDI